MARKKTVGKVRLLAPTDIYDLYVCSALRPFLSADPGDLDFCNEKIRAVHQYYVDACRERIKAEAVFLGVSDEDLETFSIADMINKIGEMVVKDFTSDDTAEQMMRGGQFNFAKSVIQAGMASGMDMTGIDVKAFGVNTDEVEEVKQPGINTDWFSGAKGRGGHLVKDSKWHVIAKAYIALEEADDEEAMIQAIDHLNSLQHNSFHILIDLQTGRMLEGRSTPEADYNEARDTLQKVLDLKFSSKNEKGGMAKLVPHVSKEVADLAKRHRHLLK